MKTIFIFITLFCLVGLTAYAQENSGSLPKPLVQLYHHSDSIGSILGRNRSAITKPLLPMPCDSLPGDVIISAPDSPIVGITIPPSDTGTANPGTPEPELGIIPRKNIYWLHGLNGSVDSWHIAAMATMYGVKDPNNPSVYIFPPWDANSWNIANIGNQTYSEDYGIVDAANQVAFMIKTKIPNEVRTDKDFIIAHSQGGIVARQYLVDQIKDPMLYPNYVHGLVTFGTPHWGAAIINNSRQDMNNHMLPFLNDACEKLSKATVKNKIKNSFFTNLVLSNSGHLNTLITSACDGLSNTIIPLAFDNYYKRTTLDYAEHANFMENPINGLEKQILNVPVVQFYGVETEPVLWRTLNSIQHIGEDQLTNSEIPFGYDNDDILPQKVNALSADFLATFESDKENADHFHKLFHGGCLNPFNWGGLPLLAHTAVSCAIYSYLQEKTFNESASNNNDAYEWLMNANDVYKSSILGSQFTQYGIYCIKEKQKIYDPAPGGSHIITYTLMQPGDICPNSYDEKTYQQGNTTVTEITTIYSAFTGLIKNHPNDGVVLDISAGKPILSSVSVQTVRLDYSNHFQMKNSSVTRDILIKLYSGTYGRTFKLNRL